MHFSKSVYVALANYFAEFGYDRSPVPKSAISTVEFSAKTRYKHHFGRIMVKKTENVGWSGGLLGVAEDCGASCALTSRPSSASRPSPCLPEPHTTGAASWCPNFASISCFSLCTVAWESSETVVRASVCRKTSPK